MTRFELPSSAGRSCVGGVTSHSRSPVPACSCSWTFSAVRPSVITTLSTYAWRRVSVDCFQAWLRSSVYPLPGEYDVIWYGPSDSVFWRNWALSGRYFMYSTGRAESKPRVRMFKKSVDGSMSLKTSVDELGALTPANGVLVS